METGHLIVGKFSHTISEIDMAVDKVLQDGQISEVREQQVKKPVIFGRCIPINAQCGSRYYFYHGIKIKTHDVLEENLDLSDWAQKSTWFETYVDNSYHTLVTIPKDFDYRRFVEDFQYRKSLVTVTNGNIENTAAPYWHIVNGHPVFTKVASFNDTNVKFFKLIKGYKRRSYYDTPRTKLKANNKMFRGCYNIVFATTGRRRRKIYIKADYGELISTYTRKCSIVSSKWYLKPKPGNKEEIQVQ